jgi:hypothetical protein
MPVLVSDTICVAQDDGISHCRTNILVLGKNFIPLGMQYRAVWFVEMRGCKVLPVSRVLKKLGIQHAKRKFKI